MPGREQQATGVVNESNAVSPSGGFIGWSPDPDRTKYKVTSADKRGPVETAVSSGRSPQFYR